MRIFFNSPKKKINSLLFIIYYSYSKKNKKFAVVVPRSVSSKAVERNLLKRRLFNILLKIEKEIKPGNYVFVVNSKIKKISKEIILKETQKILKRL